MGTDSGTGSTRRWGMGAGRENRDEVKVEARDEDQKTRRRNLAQKIRAKSREKDWDLT